jgi:hypothetical protein
MALRWRGYVNNYRFFLVALVERDEPEEEFLYTVAYLHSCWFLWRPGYREVASDMWSCVQGHYLAHP